ncbi:phage tail protein [Bacillus lacus]|uniref:Phage tail protein n=1 Tax=Metabacillus lacus TaxID=1983721 RepID=A0A7X2IW22_9BACI|nr:major tail protein [Metabacillus lacus]MRX70846.1 phage tail protein [Metabacillus lacus]
MAEKNYRASTGVDQFYYAVLTETGTSLIEGDVERVEFLQTITVELPQEIVRAHGDNKTAELAVSNGNISVTSSFHKLPLVDRQVLLGLETTTDGLAAFGSSDNPPYVACVFAKTHEDGSREWVGLPKGIFTRPSINGQTKTDSVEFQSDEISAEFMDRDVAGFSEEKSVIVGVDAKGSTTTRDALFQAVFGTTYPAVPSV